jgi:glycosyltransferase involved in cell wall biosynthesis
VTVGSLRRGPRPGVNIVGYLNHVLGLGESARQFAAALSSAGIPHACAALDLGQHAPRLGEEAVPWLGEAELPYRLTVLWANPDRHGLDVAPADLPGRRVGRWAWELTSLPDSWRSEAHWFSEIWTASRFVRAAVRQAVSLPVRVIPMPVHVPARPRPLDRGRWNLGPEHSLFLYMFDYHSTAARKNPGGAIEAFSAAFPGSTNARLVIKTINAASAPEAAAELTAAAAGNPAVQVIDAALSHADCSSLLAGCDCYVSLHRSEGFGMTIAEAMGHGRPVIATDYGGCTDFLTRRTGYPVRWRAAPVAPNPVYPAGAVWAEPDVAEAARLMREVAGSPSAAAARGRRAAARIAANNSQTAVAGKLGRTLRRAGSRRRG